VVVGLWNTGVPISLAPNIHLNGSIFVLDKYPFPLTLTPIWGQAYNCSKLDLGIPFVANIPPSGIISPAFSISLTSVFGSKFVGNVV